MTAIYRTYRPQTFAELIGQHHIKTTLLRELETDQIAHAYLFCGPRGLGKTTVARLLAKAVNCQKRSKDGEPCNECESCKEITAGNALDVIEIDAASHTGVDNVRENIVGTARFTPTKRKFKVFIIDEVHMLSVSAFNALLKTLEEPPSHAIFVLATTEIHKVPQTIISRCQRFDFRKVSHDELLKRVELLTQKEKKKVDIEVLETIVRLSEGCVRDAESLLGQILSLDDKHITLEHAELVLPLSRLDSVIDLITYVCRRDATGGIELVNKLIQDGVDLNKFIGDLLEVIRKLLLLKVGAPLAEYARNFNAQTEKALLELVGMVNENQLVLMVNTFSQARSEMKNAEIIQLPLEIAIVKLCSDTPAQPSNPTRPTPPSAPKPIPATPIKTTPPSSAAPVKAVMENVVAPIVKEIKELKEKVDEEIEEVKAVATELTITLEEIQARWRDVVTAVKTHNHSLASTLRMHPAVELRPNGSIIVHCNYKFHFDRLNEGRNRSTLETVLQQLFNQTLYIHPLLKEAPEEATEGTLATDAPNETIDAVLKAFGGQVVE